MGHSENSDSCAVESDEITYFLGHTDECTLLMHGSVPEFDDIELSSPTAIFGTSWLLQRTVLGKSSIKQV